MDLLKHLDGFPIYYYDTCISCTPLEDIHRKVSNMLSLVQDLTNSGKGLNVCLIPKRINLRGDTADRSYFMAHHTGFKPWGFISKLTSSIQT